MKKITLICTFIAIGMVAFAQEKMDNTKKIEVTGLAEIQIVPDELYFSISLKEYFKDQKNQKDKVTIDILEKQLINAIAKAGISKENLTIAGINGYKNYYGKKKPELFQESKRYLLKLSNLNKTDGILADVDERGVEYVNIDHVDHSKIKEYRREVKIKALQAAKEKANYLLESIGEKAGEVLDIKELDDQYYSPQPVYAQVRMMAANASMDAAPVGDSDLEYQKIKLSYKMMAVFKIK
jgi:uncharacterized protein